MANLTLQRSGATLLLIANLLAAGCATTPSVSRDEIAPFWQEQRARDERLGPADKSWRNAMAWLRAHQLDDGAWAAPRKVAATSAALLALLRDNPQDPGIQRAARFIASQQHPDGSWGELFTDDCAFDQMLPTWALAETQWRTGIADFTPTLQASAAFIAKQQRNDGAWATTMGPGSPASTAATAAQLLALQQAAAAGASNEAVTVSTLRAFEYLTTPGPDSRLDNIERTFALQRLGRAADDAALDGIAALYDTAQAWAQRLKAPFLEVYFMVQATLHHPAYTDNSWGDLAFEKLANDQAPDGHWAPTRLEAGGGDAYATAFAAIALRSFRGQRARESALTPQIFRLRGRRGEGLLLVSVPLRPSDAFRLPGGFVKYFHTSGKVIQLFSLEETARELARTEEPLDPKMTDILLAVSDASRRLDLDQSQLVIWAGFERGGIPSVPLFDAGEASARLGNIRRNMDLAAIAKRTPEDWAAWLAALRRHWTAPSLNDTLAQLDEALGTYSIQTAEFQRECAQRLARALDFPGRSIILLDAWICSPWSEFTRSLSDAGVRIHPFSDGD